MGIGDDQSRTSTVRLLPGQIRAIRGSCTTEREEEPIYIGIGTVVVIVIIVVVVLLLRR
jgi:uncharacterized membrane protein YidH (DUF202 family)